MARYVLDFRFPESSLDDGSDEIIGVVIAGDYSLLAPLFSVEDVPVLWLFGWLASTRLLRAARALGDLFRATTIFGQTIDPVLRFFNPGIQSINLFLKGESGEKIFLQEALMTWEMLLLWFSDASS